MSMIISKQIMLAFEDKCFCFQVTGFFYQKSEFVSKIMKGALYLIKRPIAGIKGSDLS